MDWKIEVIVLPVSDVDRAKRFYADGLGFNVDLDDAISDRMRIVQLTPPGSACSVTIGDGLTEMTPGSVTGVQMVVDDIEAARGELVGRGVEVGEIFHYEGEVERPGKGGRWNSFFRLSDPDGNRWTIQERAADS
jgi:catechol 2,3-dioxygenase-like lactoylglutathione lyase family enzyme